MTADLAEVSSRSCSAAAWNSRLPFPFSDGEGVWSDAVVAGEAWDLSVEGKLVVEFAETRNSPRYFACFDSCSRRVVS